MTYLHVGGGGGKQGTHKAGMGLYLSFARGTSYPLPKLGSPCIQYTR